MDIVLGSAIAFNLLFNIPIIAGVCITALDVLIILFLQNKRFEWIERLVFCMVATVATCYLVQLIMSKPNAVDVLTGYLPSSEIVLNSNMLYNAIGIIGATVMPHNLFLHSSIVLTRKISPDPAGLKEAIKYSTWDSCLNLTLALFVNSAILILAASVFYVQGYNNVASVRTILIIP